MTATNLSAVSNELDRNPESQFIVAAPDFLERGPFEFHGTIQPIKRDDGLWEFLFIEEGSEEWL